MESNKIQNSTTVKYAGFMFIFAFIGPTLNFAFTQSKLVDTASIINSANNVLANQMLFRIGITIELFLAFCLTVLALLLYTILKSINKNLALLALLLKFLEAAVVVAVVLISFITLQMLNESSALTVFSIDQLKVPLGFIVNAHTSLYSVPMVFLGLDMMIFSYLFYKSKYIPKILAIFGIISFALIFVHSIMYIITPGLASTQAIQGIFYAPSGIFELVIGTWLLSKGIKTELPETNNI